VVSRASHLFSGLPLFWWTAVMPRVARTVVTGIPHHVTQRGNNRQEGFFVDDDRRFYLELLARQARRYGMDVLGYSLMSNPGTR
jgi:putative transposase